MKPVYLFLDLILFLFFLSGYPAMSCLPLVINDPLLILASFLKSLATTEIVSLPEILVLVQACCQ
jgi:hypothetical protein